ncbi:MAG: DUF4932 domain-containing protein [Planctomycetota bacterium]
MRSSNIGRNALVACALAASFALPVPAQQPTATAPAIDVRVDPRIELLSVVFRLAGNPEYSQGRVKSYTDAVDAHFGEHKNHTVIQHARRLRATRGISFDAVAGYALHFDGIEQLGEAVPFDPLPARLDKRWTTADARAFAADLREFVQDTAALGFFAARQELYAGAEAAMRDVLAKHCNLAWFDAFFGARPGARFRLCLGLLNGGSNYGPSVLRADGTEDLYCVLGCWQTDDAGKPLFARTVVGTVVHEFCHSYCNPVVDAHLAQLQPAGDKLFELVAAEMKEQAYANARTMLCESLVRASVVRYVLAAQGREAAVAEVKEQVARAFHWTGELAALLGQYEQDRTTWPTLDAFAGKLVEFFAPWPDLLAAKLAKRPHVVAMTPANGDTKVDPATTAIVVTFDRPMRDQSWALVGGGEHFPESAGKLSYDEARKVLTIPVKLKPDWQYEFWLNRGKYDSFKSEDGEPLTSVHVRFKTRAQ